MYCKWLDYVRFDQLAYLIMLNFALQFNSNLFSDWKFIHKTITLAPILKTSNSLMPLPCRPVGILFQWGQDNIHLCLIESPYNGSQDLPFLFFYLSLSKTMLCSCILLLSDLLKVPSTLQHTQKSSHLLYSIQMVILIQNIMRVINFVTNIKHKIWYKCLHKSNTELFMLWYLILFSFQFVF